MFRKQLINDFRKNPGNNLVLLLFMTLSVTLAVSVFFVLVQLFTSISNMYEVAKPPHFLQMHKGALAQEDIDAFNSSYPGMEHWQTIPMIDVYGNELVVNQKDGAVFSLEECRLDISIVEQNSQFDVLLDENRRPLKLKEGEIGVPVILLEQYDIQKGDTICLTSGGVNKSFTVTDFVYDGQMNSTLCSSTRFLVSDVDFDALLGTVGETEYLIEAYFTDSKLAVDYQTAYEQSETLLPKNGQAITYQMIFLLSAMTDIMMAMVFLLVGILLIAIAMLALRYTILTTIEEDVREIGTMKAIGIPFMEIRKLYLEKIRLLMILGCITGYLAAVLLSNALFGHMGRTFGKQPLSVGILLMGIVICGVVYGIILFFAGRVIGKIRKVTVVDTLVTEKGFHTGQNGYRLLFAITLLVTLFVMVPAFMVHTMKDPQFVTYMGCAVHDILLEVEQGSDLEKRRIRAEELLQTELEQGTVTAYACERRVRLQAVSTDGELAGIHIDCGKNAGEGLQYLAGQSPQNQKEIALSCLNADELGKTVGEELEIIENGVSKSFLVCGIYQDVTSGGRTARTMYDFSDVEAEKYAFTVDLGDGFKGAQKPQEWSALLGNGYSIEYMEEFARQTIGGVTAQVQTAATVAFAIGAGLMILVTSLFIQLRLVSEAGLFAIKRAIGVPYRMICLQELYPVLGASGIGIVAGTVLSVIFGDDLISLLFAGLGLGIQKIAFTSLPVATSLLIVLVMVLIPAAVTVLLCSRIRKISLIGELNI